MVCGIGINLGVWIKDVLRKRYRHSKVALRILFQAMCIHRLPALMDCIQFLTWHILLILYFLFVRTFRRPFSLRRDGIAFEELSKESTESIIVRI